MGMFVPIVVDTPLDAVPATFTNLVARFLPHMESWYARLYKSGTITSKCSLPAAIITNDLYALVADMRDRPQQLMIGGNYRIAPNEQLELWFECTGSRYSSVYLLTQGTIAVNVHWSRAQLLSLTPTPMPIPGHTPPWPAQPATDLDALCLRVWGLLEPTTPEPAIRHGLLAPMGAWDAGPFHLYQYHRDLGGFAQDFAHMYAYYHWGIRPWTLVANGISIWELAAPERAALVTEAPPRPNVGAGRRGKGRPSSSFLRSWMRRQPTGCPSSTAPRWSACFGQPWHTSRRCGGSIAGSMGLS